ncbi:restriction endonuclease subunit S [Blautia intestinalis]|uniref:restriction endonuclease subunit S n=1 Tax=Blautia intestinalis TaxID=2763028 RepID=UPI0022E6DABF|nr:restriction endonuclease subunit S [Blautia intestinalis]
MKYKLKDIFDLQMGKTPSRNHTEYWNTKEHKWISIADLTKTGKYISETKECLSDCAIDDSGIKVIPANTVVMSFKLSIGKTAITVEDMYSNEAIMAFHDKHVAEILPEYIYYMFKYKNWDEGSNKAVMGKTLNKATLSEVEIDICSLEEQREIVKVLDKMMTVLGSRETELSLLDDLIKARFVEMFGDVIHNSKDWPIYTFSEITSSRLGKMLDAKKQTGKRRYPYLANTNVKWFRFELENLNQMDFDEAERVEFELKDGDLLVCEGGEIGRCAVWHNELQPCFFQKALHRVRCDREIILPDYLAWWFRYQCEHNGFSTIAGAKATISHLPGVKLKQLKVATPPLNLQNQFADFVQQVDKSKVAVQKALDETQKLFDSLMQQYFG